MQARLALALFLSFLVLLLFRQAFPPEEPSGGPDVVEANGPGPGPGPGSPNGNGGTVGEEQPDGPDEVPQAEPWRETLRLDGGERGTYEATFDNRGAVLAELRLDGFYTELGLDAASKRDPSYWVPLCREVDTGRGVEASLALRTSRSSAPWMRVDPSQARWNPEVLRAEGGTAPVGVRFTLDGGAGITLEKTIRLDPGTYDLLVDLVLRNTSAEGLVGTVGTLRMTPAMGTPRAANDSFYVEPKAAVSWRKGKREYGVEREARKFEDADSDGFPPREDIVFAGVDNKYFALLLRPADEEANAALSGAGWRTVWDAEWSRAHPEEPEAGYRHIATDLDLSARVPAVGQAAHYPFRLYAGPKDRAVLREHEHGEALAKLASEDLGFFDGIASLLLRILGFFHGIVGNWGAAIILLTLFVRLVLFPLNRRTQTAMARHATKMKRIQPRLNEIKEKHAKDPRKQREEQARVMQEEGAFPPLGGCLPIFLQIPVFFGLFSALRVSFDLRQAPFAGWIRDLSEPDRFMRLDIGLPFGLGVEYLNVLPPLMVVLWILQQKVMPKPTDPQAQRMQRMMMWMPILFGFFLYNYAAGLSLYMITTSLFGVLEHTVIKKIWPIDDREQPKKQGGFMDRLAKMQDQARQIEEMKRKERGTRDRQHQRRKGKGKGGGGQGKGKRR